MIEQNARFSVAVFGIMGLSRARAKIGGYLRSRFLGEGHLARSFGWFATDWRAMSQAGQKQWNHFSRNHPGETRGGFCQSTFENRYARFRKPWIS